MRSMLYVLAMLAVGLFVVVPGVSAETGATVFKGDCSGLSGTVECLAVSWTYPEIVHKDASYTVSVRASSADSSADSFFIVVNQVEGDCTATEGDVFLGDNSYGRFIDVEMNGGSTCSIGIGVEVLNSLAATIQGTVVSATTTAASDPDVATASFAPGSAMPFLVWGVVLVWAMYERLWLVATSATASLVAVVAAVPWATPVGILAAVAALWMHYGSRSLRVRDDTEDRGVSA